MPTTNRRDNPAEAIRLAIIGLDEQIADLWETRAKLSALIDQPPTGSAVKMAAPRKRRLSASESSQASNPSNASRLTDLSLFPQAALFISVQWQCRLGCIYFHSP
jgi:hypothetical protein